MEREGTKATGTYDLRNDAQEPFWDAGTPCVSHHHPTDTRSANRRSSNVPHTPVQ